MNSRESVRAAVTLVRCCVFRFIVACSVVILDTRDVNVVLVVFDSMFGVQILVNLSSESRQQPTFVDDPVEKSHKKPVEYDLPDQFRENVGRVKRDGQKFIPKGQSGVVYVCSELIDYHSQNLSLLRTVVNN